ncbi:pupal cuticle protein Edg-78E-like [Drosophila tropicalis]|uniref:pupal cuticle protein Edg-78E-like n=1 Tax=Drosophila tropicalis TaxID=46794 RepID=UPI0035AB8AB3
MFRYVLIASAVLACAIAANPNDYNAYATKAAGDIRPDGGYEFVYETSNGIAAQEAGVGGNHATGSYSYYSPEGELVQLSYLADENGFQPQSPWLPTPPPIPAAIQKSLQYIATHPQYQEKPQSAGRVAGGRFGFLKSIAG